MGTSFSSSVWKAKEGAGLAAGDAVDVKLELDTGPRTVELPDDLAEALAAAGVREAFDSLSYSARKEYVRQVGSAKAQETRDRRVAGITEKLGALRAQVCGALSDGNWRDPWQSSCSRR